MITSRQSEILNSEYLWPYMLMKCNKLYQYLTHFLVFKKSQPRNVIVQMRISFTRFHAGYFA